MKTGMIVDVIDQSFTFLITEKGLIHPMEQGGYFTNRNPWILINNGYNFPTYIDRLTKESWESFKKPRNDAIIFNSKTKEVGFIRSKYLRPAFCQTCKRPLSSSFLLSY